MNKTTKIITAIVAGVAVGAILGILFAPDKGDRTRRKIGDQGRDIADDVKNKFRRGKEKFNDFKDDIEKAVKDKVEQYV